MAGIGFTPSILANFASLPDEAIEWKGPKLGRVFHSVNQLTRFPYVPGFDTVMAKKQEQSIHAAVADGEDHEQQNNYDFAAKCYQYAITMAELSTITDLDMIVDLLYKKSSAMFKMEDFPNAFDTVNRCITIKPEFLKGYILKSKTLHKGHGIRAYPAVYLLEALQHCQLTTDEQADLITEASRLLASVARDRAHGKDLQKEDKGIKQLQKDKSTAKLPELKTVWDQVFQKLYSSQDFAAMALLSVGLPGGDICHLNSCACNFDVNCSKMVVEQVYESLSSADVESWGDRLAIFVMDHGGGVGGETKDPLGVKLVQLALKRKSLVLLQHALKTKGADTICINRHATQGDTALHVIVKSSPLGHLHQRITDLLIKCGARTDIPDASGKIPDEYVDCTSAIFKLLRGQMAGLEEDVASLTVHPPTPHHLTRPDAAQGNTNAAVERLKSEGKRALQAQDFHTALDRYKDAVTELEKTGSGNTARDLAVLYCNMAAVYASMKNTDSVCTVAKKSIELDPTYHKPYWRLGKVLLDRERNLEACEELFRGASCRETDTEQKSTFLIEICGTLPSLSEKQAESILDRMQPYLSPCWPKIVENLTKNPQWDAMRHLVLGPPCLPVDKSAVPTGWKYADRYTDGSQQKVGYAMCLKATTHDLSTLVAVVEGQTAPDVCECATDLVLALLLQGAKLETLVTEEDGSSCYHVAVNLCCLTEKLGLMRYILSTDTTMKIAQLAMDSDKRTLLHIVCLHFSDGEHAVGQELVSLLMEKGFDPAAQDSFQKKAVDYLAPGSSMTRILFGAGITNIPVSSSKTAEELGKLGNTLFKKKQYQAAIESYTQAISKRSAALPPDASVENVIGDDAERHELAVLFSNRSECHLRLEKTEKALDDAMDSVAWDGHWFKGHVRVGRALMNQKKHQPASKSFCNAFNALDRDATETQKTDVLKELIQCLLQISEEPPTRIPNLGFVSPDLWFKMAYRYFCDGNEKAEKQQGDPWPSWKAGKYIVELLNCLMEPAFGVNSKLNLKLHMDLKPLCSWLTPGEFLQTTGMLFAYLLGFGSDHISLSYYKGDTYVHAALCFTFRTGNPEFVQFIMNTFARPRNQVSLQDCDGNTALHLIAYRVHPRLPDELTTRLRLLFGQVLLDLGVNPAVRNKRGKLALECLTPDDNTSLRELFEAATAR